MMVTVDDTMVEVYCIINLVYFVKKIINQLPKFHFQLQITKLLYKAVELHVKGAHFISTHSFQSCFSYQYYSILNFENRAVQS